MNATRGFILTWATLIPLVARGADLHGTIRDSQNAEPLARVSVKLRNTDAQTKTDSDGAFSLTKIPAGHYRLVLSTVGYRLIDKGIDLEEGASLNLDFALSPDAQEHKETVEVHADRFDLEAGMSPSGFSISGTEVKNLASVLADDPLRAVQTMPGVSANDDFDSRFSLHGASFDHVGLYLDGILLHSPFHTVQGEGPSGSTAAFNGDMISSMTVETEGYSAQYEDRTAGVVDIQSREGSRDGYHFRVNASIPEAGVMAEGPLGRHHKGSFLVSERKSYLQYFLQRLAQDMPAMAFGFEDTQVQLRYDLSDNNSVSLNLIDGVSTLNRSSNKALLGLNASILARYRFTLASAGWLFTPNHSFVMNTHTAYVRERYDDTNQFAQPLGSGYYGEYLAKTDATWAWTDNAQLQFGGGARTMRGAGFANYFFDQTNFVTTDAHRGDATTGGAYAQQSFSGLKKRFALNFGGRWDALSANGQRTLSPQASLSYTPWATGRLSFAWGRYTQFPDVTSLYANNGNAALLPARSEHFMLNFEQRLDDQTRLRISAFRRSDGDLLFQPFMEARILNGQIMPDDFQYPLKNSLTNSTKGLEAFLQRRTANGWTGWVSYTYAESEAYDRLAQIRFRSDQDQRHTFNSYLSYRLRPSINLSGKFTYGSGFPIPGFLSEQNGTFYLASVRNAVRLPGYQRLDIRMNKSKTFSRAKMTLYVEVTNVLNHGNYRFDSYNGYDSTTREAYISLTQMFPVLPSAGVTFEF